MLQRIRTRPAGFTSMEFAVVLAITGILVILLATFALNTMDSARLTGAISAARELRLALDRYQVDHGSFPAEGPTDWPSFAHNLQPYLQQSADVLDQHFLFVTYNAPAASGRSNRYELTVHARTTQGQLLIITPDDVHVVIPTREKQTLTLEPTAAINLTPSAAVAATTAAIGQEGGGASAPESMLLLRFNLAGLPPDAIVTAAHLELIYSDGLPASIPTAAAYEITSDWSPSGLSPTTPPTFGPPVSDSATLRGPINTRVTFDGLTAQVAGWLDGSRPNIGIAVRAVTGRGPRSVYTGAGVRGPKLVIEYRRP